MHFGETPKWSMCSACDVCGQSPEWLVDVYGTSATTSKKKKKSGGAGAVPPRFPASLPAALPPSFASAIEPAAPATEPDHELREYLRAWRRKLAQEKGIPAFIIMQDRSLDEICRLQPHTPAELLEVFGFGERKVAAYGDAIIAALEQFRRSAGK